MLKLNLPSFSIFPSVTPIQHIWTFLVRFFSATTWFRIVKFCVHFQIGKVYCVNENWGANPHFAFFFQIFNFSFRHSYNTYGHFSSKFSQKLLELGLWNLWQFCLFSESVTTSDGYRFLLYFKELLWCSQ